MESRFRRRTLMLVSTGTAVLFVGTACGNSATFVGAPDLEELDSAAQITLTPENETEDAPVTTELEVSVEDGELTTLTLTSADGETVEGDWRADGSTWVPAEPLSYETTYTARAVALDKHEIPAESETSFTTMASPGNRMGASLWNSSEYEYGNAMPIMIDFPRDYSVPEDKRDDVERRLFVESDPPQMGAWHWFSGNHLEYRPKEFWVPGSVVKVRLGLGGLPLGDGLYGMQDISGTIHISSTTRHIEADNATKQLTATENGEVVKTAPISLGKDSTPSYSGTMIVMERLAETVFDTTAACGGKVEGDDCYRTDIQWAERLTWSGQFIHSAPWSVGDQGTRNVSHGCVNVAPDDAEWIYNFTRLGDPVVVKGTGVELPYGDGFTAYDMSWEEFLEGSYLPAPDAEDDGDEESGNDD
ncbi:Ig-like domain-containing protein [Stackebrandtia soli]|uniref:L,D-transpeptidase n=1 Tax=Stackebrandtia soli TaxID=1892856 RepID=UPI0039EC9B6E